MTGYQPAPSGAARDFLQSRLRPYVGGRFIDLDGGEELEIDDPATGRIIARVPSCGAAEVDMAVAAARSAFEGSWSKLRPADREKLILDLAQAVADDVELLAELDTLESGKSTAIAKSLVGSAVDWLRYFAGWATKIEGSTFDTSIAKPPGRRHLSMTVMEPVGVVGAIVPWNFPLLMAVWKIAPALACGCTIVLKPAEGLPLTALRFAQLAAGVGIPDGVINIITGRGETVGAALARHPGVDKLTFTGSTEVGKIIGKQAVDNMARFTLELGGKSPMIVFDDVSQGMEPLMAGLGMFFNQGQVCTSASRLLIHKPIYDKTLETLSNIADALTFGPGGDPTAQINPLVSRRHRDRVAGFIDRATAGGAHKAAGNRNAPAEGWYLAPTILDGVAPDMEIAREEVFGPVVAAMPFSDLDEAVRLANDSRYGLAASVWTRDIDKALQVAKAVKAGTVWVNSHNLVDPNAPFGGFKQSGVGREHGRAALDSYLESKTIIITYK